MENNSTSDHFSYRATTPGLTREGTSGIHPQYWHSDFYFFNFIFLNETSKGLWNVTFWPSPPDFENKFLIRIIDSIFPMGIPSLPSSLVFDCPLIISPKSASAWSQEPNGVGGGDVIYGPICLGVLRVLCSIMGYWLRRESREQPLFFSRPSAARHSMKHERRRYAGNKFTEIRGETKTRNET